MSHKDHCDEPEAELLYAHRFTAYTLDRPESKNLTYDVFVSMDLKTITMKVIDDVDGVMEKWLIEFKEEKKPLVVDVSDEYGNIVVRKLFREAQVHTVDQSFRYQDSGPLHFKVVLTYDTYEREKYPKRQA